MRCGAPAPIVGGALIVVAALFSATASSLAAEATSPESHVPTPARLKLGLYGPPAAPASTLLDLPHFESAIEVVGRAPRDPNQAMAVWWAHFKIEPPAVYGRGIAFRQPPPPGSVDLVPLVEWLAKKIKSSKD